MTLQERLRDLTKPCREVDAEIAKAFGKTAFVKSPYKSSCCECPHYTSSLDATVELVEREMPGNWDVIRLHPYNTYSGAIQGKHHSEHTIPAVALLLALVDAKGVE
jgi:hypothetical protein